jgi:hypothetical protein
MIHISKFFVLQGMLWATILLLSHSKCAAQTFQQISLASYFPAKQHKIYDFNFALSPEIGMIWQKEKFATGISLGYIWWIVGNEQVQRLNSLKIGVDESYFITIRERRIGITAGLSFMINETKFREAEFISEYESKFRWSNLAWKLGTSFVSKNNVSFDLSYFAMHPTAELPMYRFGFIQLSAGYSFSLHKR